MRNHRLKNEISFFLYDRRIEGKSIQQMKKSFREVSDILRGEKKEKKK